MNSRTDRHAGLGLTQSATATSEGLGLATWRRWEEDPDSVSARARPACLRVLASQSEHSRALAESAAAYDSAWRDSPQLTPRQAFAIVMMLDGWADTDIADWMQQSDWPLHQISPSTSSVCG